MKPASFTRAIVSLCQLVAVGVVATLGVGLAERIALARKADKERLNKREMER